MAGHILLTGGAGYIGSHTYLALVAAGYCPVILDSFANAKDDVPGRLEAITGAPVPVIRGDLRDEALLAEAFETRTALCASTWRPGAMPGSWRPKWQSWPRKSGAD